MIFFAGYNGFKQFKNCNELMISDMHEWKIDDMPNVQDSRSIKFCSSWSVNVLAVSKHLLLSGCLKGVPDQSHQLTMSDEIKAISCNDFFCLILLNNRNCYKFLFDTMESKELKFIGVDENGLTNSCEETSLDNRKSIVIEHIACGQTFSVAVTNTNAVYNIPSRIHEFPRHVKVKKVCCGAEHAMILTTNGDVYSWGSSSRGQLGLGQLDSEQIPTLIDGLAGVKVHSTHSHVDRSLTLKPFTFLQITDISCGLWHSAAVSAFGDLYMWGWNLNGQLGKPVYRNVKVNYENGRSDMVRHKDVSVFASPEVVDLPIGDNRDDDDDNDDDNCLENQFFIERVHCGHRHTIIETKCGKMLGCGFNRYGQLGKNVVRNIDHNVVHFDEINHKTAMPFIVKCGSWCTILIAD